MLFSEINIDLFDNIGDLVPPYRCFGTDCHVASSGASRPLGGAAPLGVFHGVTPSAILQELSVPSVRYERYQLTATTVPSERYSQFIRCFTYL